MDPIVVSCGCGYKYTLEQFRKLPLCGKQTFPDPPHVLEMRDCACGSTRAIWTDKEGNPEEEQT